MLKTIFCIAKILQKAFKHPKNKAKRLYREENSGGVCYIGLKSNFFTKEILMQTKILHEDNDILVVHKPAGLAVQSARIGQADVVSELKKYLAKSAGSNPYLGIIHRLDQPVEGVLVFAKNPKAAADLSRQLQGDDFCKEYLAVVCGKLENTQGELVDYLEKENGMAVVTSPEKGKKSVLQYQVIKHVNAHVIAESAMQENRSGEEQISLLRITLKTGRFHQIRVQFSNNGCPLLGDKKYGAAESLALSEKLQVRNVALCAETLTFVHPRSKEKMVYSVSPENPVFALF